MKTSTHSAYLQSILFLFAAFTLACEPSSDEARVEEGHRVAFRWATFPTQQSFEAGGDYNWGMISFGLPPGSVFDLQLVWRQDNIVKTQWIKQIECPADR